MLAGARLPIERPKRWCHPGALPQNVVAGFPLNMKIHSL
jgi:hypothetical protein